MNLKPINEHLDKVTIEDIENHKLISDQELRKDFDNLLNFPAVENKNCFYGNPILYHFQLKNLLKCRREKGKTIYEIYADPKEWNALLNSTRKRNRGGRTAAGNVYECFRINTGSIVMFKSTTAKYIYKKYGANQILDPTAGWGGRMLGAMSLNLDYTGIDTNNEMKESYENMIKFIHHNFKSTRSFKSEMIWRNCLIEDFSKIDYDFVLTSPPYINMEIYEHMPIWESNAHFYKNFFIPLWEKCMNNMRKGKVCFNISPKMMDEALQHGLKPPDFEENLLQQLGQQKNKKRPDKIYIWDV